MFHVFTTSTFLYYAIKNEILPRSQLWDSKDSNPLNRRALYIQLCLPECTLSTTQTLDTSSF